MSAGYIDRLRRQYAFHVVVDDYVERLKVGSIPRPELIGVEASWPEGRGGRAFGFDSYFKAADFLQRHGGRMAN